jgi:hypothetical protein
VVDVARFALIVIPGAADGPSPGIHRAAIRCRYMDAG